MFFGLIPLLVLAGVVVVIVKAVRPNGGSAPRDAGPVILRRFFQYATLYGVLIVVAVGFTGLLEQILPEGEVVRRGSTDAARALSFVIVGVPVYLGIGAWVNRQLDDPRERASFGWSFYLTATLLTALVVAGYAAFDVLSWVLGVEPFDEASFARGVVWGLIWVIHWFLIHRYLEPPRGEGHLIAGSAIALVGLGTALGFGLFTLLDSVYIDLFKTGIVDSFGDDLKQTLAGLIVAGALWWIYWLRNAIRLDRTPMWHVFVLLLGVLSGLSAAIGAATGMLYLILVWIFGDPDFASGARHFEVAPALVATILVGLAFFFYHRLVLAEDGPRRRTEIRRVYEYAIAGIGLLSFAGGVTVLLIAFIQQVIPATEIFDGESDLNIVLGAITFLVVGGPLWWGFWQRIQRERVKHLDSELRSRTRRAYLTLLFGVGGVVALISLVTAAFTTIEDLLDGRFGGATIGDVAPALALVITTGAIAGYHWVVYKEDRDETPAAVASPLREVVLVGAANGNVAEAVSEQLDVRVRVWQRLDLEPAPLDVAALVAELADQTNQRVMVIASPAGHEIIPFAEQR